MAAKRIALKKVKEYVNEYIEALRTDGLPVERAFLFGSYVKGRTHNSSDIDVCVISPRFNRKVDPYEYLWTKRRRNDVLRGIEPVGFHPKDFIDENPLALEIKTTGIEIWPNDSYKPSTRAGKQRRKGSSSKLLNR
jgi:predicted nucleotidyltransferase